MPDGMDITIATINYSQKKVLVSSAMNSWLYFQNGKQFSIKGDRSSIGGKENISVSFQNHIIDISEGKTQFYFYTDGYQDQLGGPKNKKFMVKNFRNLLNSIHHYPVQQQEEILQEKLESWKAQQSESQTDDILVLGFTV